tara:strand:+ start:356 stop:946 length:591 start_codon:yes stop_codon:yes gene_type:complete
MAELNEEQIRANAQDILDNKKPISFDRDIQPVIDLINSKVFSALSGQKDTPMKKEDDMMPGEAPPMDATADTPKEMTEMAAGAGPEGEMPEDEMVDDMGDLKEVLNADDAQAKAVYEAAQEMAETRGKSIKDLAKMIGDDFNLRMRLLELAAQMAEAGLPPAPAPMDPMMDAGMADAAAMAPPAAMPGGMPPEGMM